MSETESRNGENADIQDSFPAVKKLRLRVRGTRRIPFIQQLSQTECGAACLAMVLHYHGQETPLEDVRDAIGIGRDGSDALAILQAAETFGMRGRGVSLDIEGLRYLPTASILHWRFNHFVVFERVRRGGVDIVDPGFGRRFVPMLEFRRAFTGVALQLEPAESFARTPGKGSAVWTYIGQLFGQRHLLMRVVVTSVLLRLFALSLPILTGLIVDQVVPRGDSNLLMMVLLGLGVVLGFQVLSELIRAHLLLQLRTNLDLRMTLGFIDHLVALPYAFFQRRSAGDLMMRVNSNTRVRELITSNTLSTLLDGVLVLTYLVFIMLVSFNLALLVLGLGVLQVIVFLLSRRHYRLLMSRDLEAQAQSRSYLVEMLSGIETLKVVGAEQRAVERWSNLYVDEINVSLHRGRLSAIVDSVMSGLRTGSPFLILGYGAVMVMDNELSLGTMLALSALAAGFLTPLATLVNSALQLQLLGSYVERIEDVLETEPEQSSKDVAPAPQLSGRISLKNVSFQYTARSPMVVQALNVEIPAGSRIAIVGRSGAGKSTLAHLLLGLYQPTEGRILYDGKDLQALELRSLRRQFGVVTQEPYLFGSTVRENIALTDPNLPMAKVVAAAKAACIHDDIRNMPMNYETLIADGGASLSGGQRQRLALARALVCDPAVLLLDEATSSLDTATEAQITKNLARVRMTTIIIAHRLSTVMDTDQILVMDDGRLVEQGTHDELVAIGGVYATLVAAQKLRDGKEADTVDG